MTKPRVLIAMHYLELGGAETALIGLLHAWDYSRADVDLFLYAHRGALMQFIPPQVNLLPELPDYRAIESPLVKAICSGRFGVAYGRLRARQYFRQALKAGHTDAHPDLIGRHVTQFLPPMSDTMYDLAISFLTPHHPVLYKVNARRKICWIHTDYSFINIDPQAEYDTWGAYDNIISISPAVTEGFCSKFPGLRDKIIGIENIIPTTLIRHRATLPPESSALTTSSTPAIGSLPPAPSSPTQARTEPSASLTPGPEVFVQAKSFSSSTAPSSRPQACTDPSALTSRVRSVCPGQELQLAPCPTLPSQAKPAEFSLGGFNILSVGRYGHAKNFDNIPDIMRRIIAHTGRTDLHWHIIGYGSDEALIRRRISEARMSAHVHLLGKRDNPYPYIAACDLYIQPSRYEGKSIAVREAQMLGRPVIITDYSTARSQLIDGVDGLIVPLDNAPCARAIADAITSPTLLPTLAAATLTRDYSGSDEINKIYPLLTTKDKN